MSPCLNETKTRAGHLATLTTLPVLAYMCLKDPSSLGHNSESKGKWLTCHNRTWLKPCARPTGPHEGDQLKASRPPWRGSPPIVSRVGASWEELVDMLDDRAMDWDNNPELRARWLRCYNCTWLRPCARPTGPHKGDQLRESGSPWRAATRGLEKGSPLGRRLLRRQGCPGPELRTCI
jgi:hypothetical protein